MKIFWVSMMLVILGLGQVQAASHELNEDENEFFIACRKDEMRNVHKLLKSKKRVFDVNEKVYIDVYTVDINKQNFAGDTALMVACKNKHVDVALAILNSGRVVYTWLKNEEGHDALYYAKENHLEPVVTKLMDLISLFFINACKEGLFVNARYLLGQGANINAYDNPFHTGFGETILTWACRNNNLEVVQFLLGLHDPKLDVNLRNKPLGSPRKTPLMLACENGNIEIVQELLALKNPDGTFRIDLNEKNPLEDAYLVTAMRLYHGAIMLELYVRGAALTAITNYTHIREINPFIARLYPTIQEDLNLMDHTLLGLYFKWFEADLHLKKARKAQEARNASGLEVAKQEAEAKIKIQEAESDLFNFIFSSFAQIAIEQGKENLFVEIFARLRKIFKPEAIEPLLELLIKDKKELFHDELQHSLKGIPKRIDTLTASKQAAARDYLQKIMKGDTKFVDRLVTALDIKDPENARKGKEKLTLIARKAKGQLAIIARAEYAMNEILYKAPPEAKSLTNSMATVPKSV